MRSSTAEPGGGVGDGAGDGTDSLPHAVSQTDASATAARREVVRVM
jgi:hypothetical protein